MSKQPETKFKERFKKQLDKIPKCWYFKVQLKALRGIPDIIGVVNGRFFAFELKIETNSADSLQSRTLWRIARCGGFTSVVKPSNADSVIETLTAFAKGE